MKWSRKPTTAELKELDDFEAELKELDDFEAEQKKPPPTVEETDKEIKEMEKQLHSEPPLTLEEFNKKYEEAIKYAAELKKKEQAKCSVPGCSVMGGIKKTKRRRRNIKKTKRRRTKRR